MSLSATQPDRPETTHATSSDSPLKVADRLISIDVYRGMVMFLMLAEGLHLYSLAQHFPGNFFLEWLRFHTTHVDWAGCSLHDLIQPGFTFLVGVAMPFSIAARIRKGDSRGRLLVHAVWRSLVLIAIGIVLRSLGQQRTNFTFEDTLTQIGLGYFFVVLIALAPRWLHYVSAIVILVLFWLAFAVSPPPPEDFDYPAVSVAADWPNHESGFASRWNKNSNVSWKVDQWFMNLFPRDDRFVDNEGGYSTLSFVPTAVTMLFGLIAGVWLLEPLSLRARSLRFMVAIVIGIGVGGLLDWAGICPLVKRIWTPSFTLYSGGICMLWLLMLHLVCDVGRFHRWAFPFIIIGANSIFIYVASWTVIEPLQEVMMTHFSGVFTALVGSTFAPVMASAAALAVMFYVLWWMYERRIFIKI